MFIFFADFHLRVPAAGAGCGVAGRRFYGSSGARICPHRGLSPVFYGSGDGSLLPVLILVAGLN